MGRVSVTSILAGLGLGADDYIAKPFLPQNFLLRVYAVLRRCYREDAEVLKLEGCTVRLGLACSDAAILLTVADNGVGLSAEKLRELEERPHYMESTDERLDLRHGLGLLLVRQIVEAHGGEMKIKSAPRSGCKITLAFQRN